MTELSPAARRLVELARHQDTPDKRRLERIEGSLTARVAQGAALATAGTLVAKSAAGVGSVAGVMKAIGVAGVAVVVGGAGWFMVARSPENPRLKVPASSESQAQPVAPRLPVPLASLAEPEPSEDSRSVPRDRTATTLSNAAPAPASRSPSASFPPEQELPDPPDQLPAETRGLAAAQQALRAGDATRALSLLGEQDQSYRGGLLEGERAAARVLALCQSGRRGEARSEAIRFEQRWPRSPLLARVRSSCRDP